ncbi:calpain-9 [Diaporthe helianthi]|uniref:Calpain-9 n=1 Tax=Diaporthe helianthi TaxID=158607 RepID=A0A2P5HPI3_DIAHE|nr:calpain-9 [Diaporthe helianthi]
MAQLDTRYFKGLEGQYHMQFSLYFVLRKQDIRIGDYICTARPAHGKTDRSVSSEIHLEAGQYEVVPQITAERVKKDSVEFLVPHCAEFNPQKLRQVGLQYDLAHAKGGIPDEDLNIELGRSKSKRKPYKTNHSHIDGKCVQFRVDGMSPEEPMPSKRNEGGSEDQAELDEFQYAAEATETNGDEGRTPGDMPKETLPAWENQAEVAGGETPQGKEPRQSGMGRQDLPLRAKRSEGEAVAPDGRHLRIDVHTEPPMDGCSDSDDSEGDDDQWNAVYVAFLRISSRDPDLTITLVEGNYVKKAQANWNLRLHIRSFSSDFDNSPKKMRCM